MVIDLPGRTEPFQLHEFGNRGPSPGQCLDQAQPHGVPQSSERVGRLGPVRTQHRTRYVFGTWLRRGAPHSLLKLGEPPRNLGDLPDQRVPWRRRITHSASLSSDAREWTSPTEVNLRSIRPGSATASNSVWKQVISPVFSPTSSWDRTKPHVLQADEQVDFAAPHRLFPSADSPPTARSGAASSMRAGSRRTVASGRRNGSGSDCTPSCSSTCRWCVRDPLTGRRQPALPNSAGICVGCYQHGIAGRPNQFS
ncbi:hypothetical protein ABID94_005271 [Streptomyces sp. PvR018]